jgi:imidazole glycerol-phosphate synthase subunit HisH
MSVVIVDYGSGNIRSVAKSLERISGTVSVSVSSDPASLKQATHIVLPGVGAFADCMQGLKNIPGMCDALQDEVLGKKKPFLGICVGMQLLATKGFEHGEHAGLNWIEGSVEPISGKNNSLKIPHMGWNELFVSSPPHPLLKGITSGQHAYFVHSYHFICKDNDNIVAHVDYGDRLAAVLVKGNIAATQFHPEKSQETGLTLLRNFLEWAP